MPLLNNNFFFLLSALSHDWRAPIVASLFCPVGTSGVQHPIELLSMLTAGQLERGLASAATASPQPPSHGLLSPASFACSRPQVGVCALLRGLEPNDLSMLMFATSHVVPSVSQHLHNWVYGWGGPSLVCIHAKLCSVSCQHAISKYNSK